MTSSYDNQVLDFNKCHSLSFYPNSIPIYILKVVFSVPQLLDLKVQLKDLEKATGSNDKLLIKKKLQNFLK